ncbi:MAG: hypothetical protein Tsb002_32930 [Wenzhouxiangellaceae bacterium]
MDNNGCCKLSTRLFGIMLLSIITTAASAETGLVNFNLGKSPVADSPVQPVTLYGCNQTVESELFWGTDNQIVGDIPYGNHVSESGKAYHISKYYIVSPPAFRKAPEQGKAQKPPYIGLVTPDNFSFQGKQPAQIVYFDYRILKPTYLTYVTVDYNHKNDRGESCADLGVNLIPVNTQCHDFPWRNGAKGASGIGETTQSSNRIFLPLLKPESDPLQCDVTILNDILLDHEVFFVDHNKQQTTTVSLTEHHNNKQAIKLACYRRPANEAPAGCCPNGVTACTVP